MTASPQSARERECPYARSDMTPCAMKDGECATFDDKTCVGCGATPSIYGVLSAPETDAAGGETPNLDEAVAYFDPGERARMCGDGARADAYEAARSELSALKASRQAALARCERMEKALRLVHDWRGLCDEGSLETWERIAEDFRRDTGFLRPGKDYAMASGFTDEEGQRRAWEAWCERKNAEVNAALRAALSAKPEEQGT